MKEKDRPITHIDLDNLEVEWRNQPKKVERYSEEFARAKKDLALAEASLDYVKADLGKKIRSEPVKYGIGKSTNDSVNETIILQTEYQEANLEVINFQYKVDLLRGILTALDNRKKALEEEVFLFSINYFASPRQTKEVLEKTTDEAKRRTRQKASRRMNE